MNRLAFRCLLPAFLFSLPGCVYALGLGELRGQPVLGEPLRLEVEILGEGKAALDASCFRLSQPVGAGDLPWLKKASLSLRKGPPSILEIRSAGQLREPVMQIALQLGCGHEIGREYVILASPAEVTATPVVARPEVALLAKEAPVQPRPRSRSVAPKAVDVPEHLAPRKPEKRKFATDMPDRLMLSNGIDVGEPSLRLATELLSLVGAGGRGEASEAQRDILRLEFRMLLAMNEQATTQLAAAEKLRNMENTLAELQQRAVAFSQRVENGAAPVVPPVSAPVVTPVLEGKPAVESSVPRDDTSSGLSEWSFYGALLGALLGLVGWFGWRNYRGLQQRLADAEYQIADPDLKVDPTRDSERDEAAAVDFSVEPEVAAVPGGVDLELDAADGQREVAAPLSMNPSRSGDSILSISATTLDEHFEANPVMELADIMLSFGRVKGAAQALQEYIDNNPQEALQPWIRLMDVYRMAGMRAEFESVSRNLNQNFNVAIQEWAPAGSAPALDLVLEDEPKAAGDAGFESLEEMPRLMKMVCDLWGAGDVVGYLYQLLRDNRGGQRVGFALTVVEEILFLIELKETAHRMEKEPVAS